MSKATLIVAGGGTGGHVLAGVAVADAWKAKHGERAEILFVGAYGGIEEKLVPRAGYRLELLSLGSLNRVSWARRWKTLFQLPWALLKSLRILLEARPQAVLGVGGYASGPLVLMARFFSRGALTAILEQNSVAGLTNRILGRWVHRIFSAFPGIARAEVTGNPIRSTFRPLPPAQHDPFTVFVFGGSQGAIGINSLVLQAIPLLSDLKIHWIHQTGEKDWERVRGQEVGQQFRVERFIYDMEECYKKASVLICRSGSSTLSEIAAVGRASVLIPFPQASDNHQEINARVLVDAGGAVLLRQEGATGVHLAELIRKLHTDRAVLARMEQSVRQFYRPDAASQIVVRLSEGI